jgi:hypothetical protein
MQVWNKRWMHAAAVAVGLTCGASAARAQGALVTGGTVLAHIGDVVNGLSPTTFGGTLGFSIPMLDENGQVVFSSSMVGGTATNGANDKAILRGTTRANLAVVIRGEDPAPGLPGIVLSDAAGTSSMSSLMRLSADGRVLFATSLRDPVNPLATTVDSARMGGVIGSFAPLVREGDAAPGTVGATLTQDLSSLSQQNSGLNRSGRVLVLGSLANGDTTSAAPPAIANDQGWWSGIPGSLELVQRKGDTPAGAPGTNILSFGTVSQMNISGQVVFNSTLSTVLGSPPATAANNNILSIYTPGPSTAKIVREGDAATGTVGATFNNAADTWASDIGLNAFNNSGQVGAWWELLGGDVVGTTNNAALYRASSSGMTMIMRKGDVAPGTGGARFSAVTTSSVLMNSAGRFAVLGTLVQDAITPVPPVTATNDTGVWVGNEFGLTLVMREGDTAPLVAGGGTITGFTVPFLFNDLGQVLFRATFTGGTATNALYSWDPLLGLTLQMANTDMIEVQPGVFKAPIAWGTTQHNNGDSASLSFNHAGKFVLRMNHIVGTTIISGQVQSPLACRARNSFTTHSASSRSSAEATTVTFSPPARRVRRVFPIRFLFSAMTAFAASSTTWVER